MSTNRRLRSWRHALIVVFVLVPVVNYLPMLLDIDQARFTRGMDTRVDAAGYAFSVWGVIFSGMLLFAVFLSGARRGSRRLLRAVRFLVLAGLASIAFVPISFGANYLLGAADLLWHLLALIFAYRALRAYVRSSGKPRRGWTYFAPSMYLGWVSAATVISVALALQQLGYDPGANVQVWMAVALLVLLTGVGLWLGRREDAVFALTVAWALVAIAVEQRSDAKIFWAGTAGAGLLAGFIGFRAVRGDPLCYFL